MAEFEDIYTKLHGLIWDALNAYTPFTDLVDLRNRVDMTADDFEDFPANTPADATPEVAIIQGTWSQGAFTTGMVGVDRSQTYNLVITAGNLSPVDMNRVKEHFLEALLLKGIKLGLSQPVNGVTVIGWSVAGDDSLVPVEAVTGEDRQAIRSQSVARITVVMKKALPARPFQ